MTICSAASRNSVHVAGKAVIITVATPFKSQNGTIKVISIEPAIKIALRIFEHALTYENNLCSCQTKREIKW